MSLTSNKPYFVYILWSDTGRCFYKGLTDDVPQRLKDHINGISKWTKRYAGSWQLAWQREFPNISAARKFENKLKKQKGGQGFWSLTGLDPNDFPNHSS